MALLDIEKAIGTDAIRSRFRLVSMASQRARELNTMDEGTLAPQDYSYTKVTTSALCEITTEKVYTESTMDDTKTSTSVSE
jgi:DNA-directed RNA polymerase omega subunit